MPNFVRELVSLKISKQNTEGVTILTLSGRLVLGNEASALHDAIESLSPEDNRVILNLAEVPFIDSTGLGTLVAAHSHMSERGGALRLLHASKRHIELLVLTKLTTIFQLFDDQNDAIDSFFPDRESKGFDILQFVKRREPTDPIS